MLWTEEERQALARYVSICDENSRKSWVECAAIVKTKNPRQCYDFYSLQVKQNQVNKPHRHTWTQEECEVLMRHDEREMTWKEFQEQFFPNLTLGQLKNQANLLKGNHNDKKREAKQISIEKKAETTQDLVNFLIGIL